MQEAAAAGLELAKTNGFFEQQQKEYAERRTVLLEAFDKLGLNYTVPQGTYFALLVSIVRVSRVWIFKPKKCQDISRLQIPEDYPFPAFIQSRGKDFKCVPPSKKYELILSIEQSLLVHGLRSRGVLYSGVRVLLRRALSYRRGLCSLRFLQRLRYAELSGGEASEASQVHSLELDIHTPDVISSSILSTRRERFSSMALSARS